MSPGPATADAPSSACPGPPPLPVLASTAVRGLLSQPSTGRVLGSGPAALYVGLPGGVLALLTPEAVRLPNALVLGVPSARAPFAAHVAGEVAAVEDGVLQVGRTGYVPARWWAPREQALPGARLDPAAVTELAGRLGTPERQHEPAVAAGLAAGCDLLAHALQRADAGSAAAAADALLGLGPGLTPAGDDVLAGALVTCAQLRPLVGGAVLRLGVAVLAGAATRTTALSASLLAHAAAGRAAPPVLELVDALVGRRELVPALGALLEVGHTSGADTARGVLVAATALTNGEPSSGGRP